MTSSDGKMIPGGIFPSGYVSDATVEVRESWHEGWYLKYIQKRNGEIIVLESWEMPVPFVKLKAVHMELK